MMTSSAAASTPSWHRTTTIDPSAVRAAIEAAKAAPYTSPGRGYGCGRVYVSVTGDRKVINAVQRACSEMGLIFQRRGHYNTRNVIYIGYDNAKGDVIARGEAFAKMLSEHGLLAYSDAFED